MRTIFLTLLLVTWTVGVSVTCPESSGLSSSFRFTGMKVASGVLAGDASELPFSAFTRDSLDLLRSRAESAIRGVEGSGCCVDSGLRLKCATTAVEEVPKVPKVAVADPPVTDDSSQFIAQVEDSIKAENIKIAPAVAVADPVSPNAPVVPDSPAPPAVAVAVADPVVPVVADPQPAVADPVVPVFQPLLVADPVAPRAQDGAVVVPALNPVLVADPAPAAPAVVEESAEQARVVEPEGPEQEEEEQEQSEQEYIEEYYRNKPYDKSDFDGEWTFGDVRLGVMKQGSRPVADLIIQRGVEFLTFKAKPAIVEEGQLVFLISEDCQIEAELEMDVLAVEKRGACPELDGAKVEGAFRRVASVQAAPEDFSGLFKGEKGEVKVEYLLENKVEMTVTVKDHVISGVGEIKHGLLSMRPVGGLACLLQASVRGAQLELRHVAAIDCGFAPGANAEGTYTRA